MEETIKNLAKAFIGESQARNRYTMYSNVANKEGFKQLSELFLLTADNEREHAKWLFRMIQDLKKSSGKDIPEIAVDSGCPTVLGDTKENLKAAIAGETYEYESMYPEFADKAEEEGLKEIAQRLRAIAIAEKHHEQRYTSLLKEVENNSMFKKSEEVEWVCRKCGFTYKDKQPPEKCPSCDHPPEYFELKCETY